MMPDAPSSPLDGAIVRNGADGHGFFFEQQGLSLVVQRAREARDGVHGELSVSSTTLGTLHWGALNLASTSARETLVRKLSQVQPQFPWRGVLDRICRDVTMQIREGMPAVTLQPIDHPQRELVAKLLRRGDPTVLVAPPGHGKGYFALAVALALEHDVTLPGGLEPREQTSTLYADYEWHRAAQEVRLARLVRGMTLSGTRAIRYRRMTRPLADDVTALRRELERAEAGLLIVDSYFLAAGEDPYSAEAAGRIFAALRELGDVTTLILTHASWEQTERPTGVARPIGTVQVEGQARLVWGLRRAEGEDEDVDTLTVGLFHRKANEGRLHAPIGLRFVFGRDMVRLEAATIADAPDLLNRASLGYQVLQVLRDGAKTIPELADATGRTEGTIRKEVHRLRNRGKVLQIPDPAGTSGGRGHAPKWGAKAP